MRGNQPRITGKSVAQRELPAQESPKDLSDPKSDLFFRFVMNQIEYYQKKGLFSCELVTQHINLLLALTGVYLFILAQLFPTLSRLYSPYSRYAYFLLLAISTLGLTISYAVNRVFRREWVMIRYCRRQERKIIQTTLEELPQTELIKTISRLMGDRLLTIHDDSNPKYAEGTKKAQLVMTSCVFSFYVVDTIILLYLILNTYFLLPSIDSILIYVLPFFMFICIAVATYRRVKPPLADVE